jgi:WD40 repeat protein
MNLLRHFRTTTVKVLDVAFSPDGKRLTTASLDWTAKVWDAFSRDGTRVATVSADGTTKVWDAAAGKEIYTWGGTRRRGVCRSL